MPEPQTSLKKGAAGAKKFNDLISSIPTANQDQFLEIAQSFLNKQQDNIKLAKLSEVKKVLAAQVAEVRSELKSKTETITKTFKGNLPHALFHSLLMLSTNGWINCSIPPG